MANEHARHAASKVKALSWINKTVLTKWSDKSMLILYLLYLREYFINMSIESISIEPK